MGNLFFTIKTKTKKFFAMCALALFLLVAGGYGVYISMDSQPQLSDLAMANIEALASVECVPSIEQGSGPIITVTVCDRRNHWLTPSVRCSVEEPGRTCQFTN